MTIFPKEFNVKVLIQDALDRKIIWHVYFDLTRRKKLLIIDVQSTETRIYFVHTEGIFIMQNLTCHETRWYLFHEARLSYLRCFVSYEQTCMNNFVYVCRHSLFGICCDDKLRGTMKRA